jgi:primosomal protein N'
VTFVDCPLCEAPGTFHPETGALDCEACAVQLALADEPAGADLATAA